MVSSLDFSKETTPSISETTAGFEGLRASNNSVILGKPPVISPALEERRGFLPILYLLLIFFFVFNHQVSTHRQVVRTN